MPCTYVLIILCCSRSMWWKHFVDACGRMHDQQSSDNDSDVDLGSLAEGKDSLGCI